MADKCPYCYRNLGSWQKDPILIPTGAKYDWIDDTHLVFEPDIDNRWYKGCQQICEPEVQEIQDELKALEVDNAITPLTVFSPLNDTGKFQITGKHIKEMRDSVEKLLDALGLTKTDYFNYDEDGNHIIHPNGDKVEWTDPITEATDLQKFQVKYIHIEDLRHYIQSIWIETWDRGIPYIETVQSINYDRWIDKDLSQQFDHYAIGGISSYSYGHPIEDSYAVATLTNELTSEEDKVLKYFASGLIYGTQTYGHTRDIIADVEAEFYFDLLPIRCRLNSTLLLSDSYFHSTGVLPFSGSHCGCRFELSINIQGLYPSCLTFRYDPYGLEEPPIDTLTPIVDVPQNLKTAYETFHEVIIPDEEWNNCLINRVTISLKGENYIFTSGAINRYYEANCQFGTISLFYQS